MEITFKGFSSWESMINELPETLYKYRFWNNEDHRKTITNRELFYAAPSSFEDPMDCKAVVRYDMLTKEEQVNWMAFRYEKDEPNLTPQYYKNKALKQYPSSIFSNPDKLIEFQNWRFSEEDKRTGVLSLTADPDSEKMWEKYGDSSKGFCIGFHSIELFKHLGGGGNVHYFPELPIVHPEPIHSQDEHLFYRLFCKEDKWSFEKEYRTHTFRFEPMSIDDRIIKVAPNAYKELLIGSKMSDADFQTLKDSIPEELRHMNIIRKD